MTRKIERIGVRMKADRDFGGAGSVAPPGACEVYDMDTGDVLNRLVKSVDLRIDADDVMRATLDIYPRSVGLEGARLDGLMLGDRRVARLVLEDGEEVTVG